MRTTRKAIVAAGLLGIVLVADAAAADPLPLKVSENGRHFVQSDGSPFFYLGDTAWELFHRLDREETTLYLDNRAARGFTVIQAVALAEFNGLTQPNRFGHLPLEGSDPTKPIDAYFDHVDWVVAEAGERALYIGLLPTWGDKWAKKWGTGPEVFTPENARVYGEWIGERYKESANIIWILGGDRSPETDLHNQIIHAMAGGIREAVGEQHLMTFHPQGYASSSKFFHDAAWLDFNYFQSSHGAFDVPNYNFTAEDYARTPIKPVLDGEPRYEDHPVNWKPELGWFDAFDARQAAYWSLLSGAAGHTYGDHSVWQFLSPANPPVSAGRTPWKRAIEHEGAADMKHVRDVLAARPWHRLVPDQSLLTVNDEGAGHQRAARAADGSFVLVYSPLGKPVSVKLDGLNGGKVKATWFDPRSGESKVIGERSSEGIGEFDPPGEPGRGNDWLLILDDAERESAPLP